MVSYDRRNLLKGGAAFAGASALGFPAIVRAQAAKIKIGHLVPLTGFLGAIGGYAQLGVKLAAEEIKAAKVFFDANGATLIGDELIATDVTDFSPYLLKIRQAKPDVVCCNLAGNQVTNLVKQFAEFGFPYPLVGFNLNTGDAWAMGEGNLSGTWPTVWYHTLDNPASKAFVAAFSKKYGKPPENHAWIEYITLKLLAQAINETKSTESDALIAYFEKQTEFDIMKARKAYFRSWDHQLVQEAYPFTVKPKNEMKDKWDMLVLGEAVPAAGAELESIYPTKTQNPCNMKA